MFTTIISPEELSGLLEKTDLSIIDCRFALANTNAGKEAYDISHVPGAHYAHLDDDLSGAIIPGKTGRHPFPEVEEFAQKCGRWGINENTQVVAYDYGHGGIAARLWFLLKWLGHEKVAVLNGGWNNWLKQRKVTTPNIPGYSSKRFYPKINNDRLVDVKKMESLIGNHEFRLVDSRAAPRYRGEEEPIDRVAGHMPGAVSAPFFENLGEDGLMKDQESLKERFDRIIGEHPPENTVFYCGSGVTACHNLLALAHIGIDNVKLFPGSWSEWIVDPGRPIETGSK